jgi:hypothetical protein
MISSSLLFAQTGNFDTHIIDLKGELSSNDAYQDNFGRFDAYQLNMQEGDFIKLKLTAEFFPLITIVSPSGKHEIAFPDDQNPEVDLEKEIKETGKWYIYIAGDSTDVGKHELKLCYVAENTRMLPPDADICKIAQFLLAHSNTAFFYYREKECDIENGSWDVTLPNQNLFDNSEVKMKGNLANIVLERNGNKNKFGEMSYKISECLSDDWIEKGTDNQTTFTESSGARKIKIKYEDGKIILTVSNSIE